MTRFWSRLVSRLTRSSVRAVPVVAPPGPSRGRRVDTRTVAAPPAAGPQARNLLSYAPQLDGQADPGEIVWTWVAYEDDPLRGKDRPVLVVGRDGKTLLGLMLSSQSDRADQRHWLGLGPGAWDRQARPSWVRLDRVLTLADDTIRREGAVLDRRRFDTVAKALRDRYGWG